jgi:hypothetical protein
MRLAGQASRSNKFEIFSENMGEYMRLEGAWEEYGARLFPPVCEVHRCNQPDWSVLQQCRFDYIILLYGEEVREAPQRSSVFLL